MSSLIQQRRALLEQMMQDDYPGFEFGVFASTYELIHPICVTDYIEVPSTCASIKVMHYCNDSTIRSGFSAHLYDSNKAYTAAILYNNPSSSKSESITAGQSAYIRATLNLDKIDDCYIYDNTNGAYLWKGKNIV